jgi:hypothetical protein
MIILGIVLFEFADFKIAKIETDATIIKLTTIMDIGNSGISQTEEEVIFIIWVVLV